MLASGVTFYFPHMVEVCRLGKNVVYLLGSGAKERDSTPQALPWLYWLTAQELPELPGDVHSLSSLCFQVLIVCATQSESFGPWSSFEILFLQCR